MAKGQVRGNKEAKKPKQPKKPETPPLPWGSTTAASKAGAKKGK